jgi:hypothetical protein
MATESTSPTRAPRAARQPLRRALEALFPEARQRARRRRLLLLALCALIAAVAVVVIGTQQNPGPQLPVASSVSHAPRASVSSTQLPTDGLSSITVSDGKLLLSGGRMAPSASGVQVNLRHGRVDGDCNSVLADPHTLKLGPIKQANCGNPALYGRQVLPVASWTTAHTPTNLDVIDVRIARSDPGARDGYTLGPVVTSWAQCSDCQGAWLYGDGSLWIYNPLADPAGPPRQRAVLLRVSEQTGAVLQRWRMPEIIRALLAANRNGLWLSPSIESGTPGHLSRVQRVPFESLYHVIPRQRAPRRVLSTGPDGARWLVASGTTATIAVSAPRRQESIETITSGHRTGNGAEIPDAKLLSAADYGRARACSCCSGWL